MSTKSKIAAIATLATLIAAPAFALDEDTAAATVNSGRYFGQQANVPSGAYASAVNPARIQASRAMVAGPASDFQLQGR